MNLKNILISLFALSASSLLADNAALNALAELREFKLMGVETTSSAGWLPANIVDIANKLKPQTILPSNKNTELEIIDAIKQSKVIYISSYFLGNADILQAIVYAKRINNAFIVCILEDKLNISGYITPDFLSQNGVLLFLTPKNITLQGNTLILDNSKVYSLFSFEFDKYNFPVIKLTEQRDISEAEFSFYTVLNVSKVSDYTEIHNPNALRLVSEHLTNSK